MKYMLIAPNMRKNIHSITVKELQVTLKNALKKIKALDVKNKLGIDNFDGENITRFRNNCKKSKTQKYILQINSQ
jgi:hypothetical protein